MATKAERTREFIIEKAAPLFNKKGYANTSMQDIMEATGLAKGGLYGNFKNKDEIATAAFEYSYQRLKEDLGARVGPKKTALEKLQAILQYYRNYTVNPPIEGGCPLINTGVDADDNYPFLKKKTKEALLEMLHTLQRIFKKGVDNGEFAPDLDQRREAEIFYAQIEGAIMMAKVSDDVSLLNRMLDNLKDRLKDIYAR
ncbi:TetR/AcrR family transcriptional regulator [Paraflavitalea pollutisoli]|uniref:TetR/AcrR family transcriptional regulator n=1 Tax=Paraflavitalea pollutisoli TaxID=3034143 RepID=UPI0023EE1078|nr:TetR/AcrR family transcriptional regulator [Paraflavitalea sp. H1-2-19X]